MEWIQKRVTVGNIIEIIILVVGLVWLVAFIRSDINRNTEWNMRQDEEHAEFMRQDVGNAQFKAIRNQLDRIEKKIDD